MTVAKFIRLKLGTGLTGTDLGGGVIKLDAAAGGDPASDTHAWMPLVDSDGTCVLDGTGDLIPTLIAI